ncbi:reverse transcriptase domain-containing protein [Tanacetum coccineum]
MPSHVILRWSERSGGSLKVFQSAQKQKVGLMRNMVSLVLTLSSTDMQEFGLDKAGGGGGDAKESIDSSEIKEQRSGKTIFSKKQSNQDRWKTYIRKRWRIRRSFMTGEVAALSHGQRKTSSSWKPSEGGNKPNFKKGFKNKQRSDRKPDRFSLLTKTPKEIFALERGKFKAPPPMPSPGLPKASLGGRTAIFLSTMREDDGDGREGPMIIEVDMAGHFVHRVYIDGGASSEVLYEHCFIKLRKEIRDQMVPATTHLIGFSGETIWPLGGIRKNPRKLAVPSTAHGMLKFPVEGGTVTLQSSRVIPMECAMISGPSIQTPAQILGYLRLEAADVSGVPRNIATPLEYPGGIFTSQAKKKRTSSERNKVIPRGRWKKLVDARIMKGDFKILITRAQRLLSFNGNRLEGESLCGFLSKSAEKSLPFFKTLKNCTKKSDFQWTPEAEEAFKQMKKLIAELPTLTAPREREELIIYLAAAKEAISAVLMTDREGRQIPVYFVSRTLRGPEVNYTPMEKLVLALLSASKRLKRYFQAHTVVVITNQPIKQLLSSSEISGRMLKWKFELEGYDIQYRPKDRNQRPIFLAGFYCGTDDRGKRGLGEPYGRIGRYTTVRGLCSQWLVPA